MKNLQYLADEIFKVENGVPPIIMNEVLNFRENESYNLRSAIHLASRNMHPTDFGTDIIPSLGKKLWKLIPEKINVPQHYQTCLNTFKAKIKSWTINNCPWRLCKIFVKDLAFVEVCPESLLVSTLMHRVFFSLNKGKKF